MFLVNIPAMNSLKCEVHIAPILCEYEQVGQITLRPLTGDVIKIGFEVFETFQGRGYATKALEQAVSVLSNRGFFTFLTGVHSNNRASQTVLFKNGFRVDYITKESDGTYYQCRLEKHWAYEAKKAYWMG